MPAASSLGYERLLYTAVALRSFVKQPVSILDSEVEI